IGFTQSCRLGIGISSVSLFRAETSTVPVSTVSTPTSSFSSLSRTRSSTQASPAGTASYRLGPSARSPLRYLFDGQQVLGWAGPYRGTRAIAGEDWVPYQPTTFPTPPFPEYSSGHSTFSAAGAEILRLFTGRDRFGGSVALRAGSSKVEPGAVPSRDVRLSWATFSKAADQAGMSRRYGGIHFERGDLDARATGRIAAQMAWKKAQEYWDGC